MRLYLAGLYAASFYRGSQGFLRLNDAEKASHARGIYQLESYHYVNRQLYVDRIRSNGIKIFLDSGAFSAFTSGVEIDLRAYCDYIKRNIDIIDTIDGSLCASVLDGIGDPLKTWQNQMSMEQMGIRPLPCFHYGEDERYLEWYMANYDYITLGGMVPISTPQLYLWLDRIWDRYLTDGSGNAKLKVHGFGLTTVGLMERYPWYSVDSTSWVQSASMGNIIFPEHGTLAISSNSPSRKIAGRHYDTISPEDQKAVEQLVVAKGYEIERLRTFNLARWAWNCGAYADLADGITSRNPAFKDEQMRLF